MLKKYPVLAFSVLSFTILSARVSSAQQFSEWSTPVNLGPIVNAVCAPGTTTCNDERPNISKDGLSLYFSSDRPGGCGGADVYVSQRSSVDSPWEAPINLDKDRLSQGSPCVVNSNANESAPNLTTDGHTLFFHSFRVNDNCGGGDIYAAHRKNRRDDLGWETPVNLNRVGRDPREPLPCGGATDLKDVCLFAPCLLVNTPKTDAGPAYFHDDTTNTTLLYFTRTNLSTNLGDFDIYTSILGSDGIWGTVVYSGEPLSTTPHRDTRVAIRRRDGLEIILASERPGFPAGSDARKLWVATRNSTLDPWSTPVLLSSVNSTALDGAPGISWDGTELYFFSTRAGGATGSDLYVATRTKINGH